MAQAQSKLNYVWIGAGFAFALLTGAVVWLALTVADLRSTSASPVAVVQTGGSPVEAPPLPDPVKSAAKPAPSPSPDSATTPKGAVKLDRPEGYKFTTAGQLGIAGLPEDAQVVEATTDDFDPGRGRVGTADGVTTDDGATGEMFAYKQKGAYTKTEYMDRLDRLFPGVREVELTRDEIAEFQDTMRTNFRAEAAILHTLRGSITGEEANTLLTELGAAIFDKWKHVNPSSTPDEFARADEIVLKRLQQTMPPGIVEAIERNLESDEAFADLPTGDELGEIGYVVRSLMTKGLTGTVLETDEMRAEIEIQPPPEGMSEDDPMYKEMVAQQREHNTKIRTGMYRVRGKDPGMGAVDTASSGGMTTGAQDQQ